MTTATLSAANTTAETTMLVCVDPGANANKFYSVTLAADGTVTSRYGRVGEDGKPGVSGNGRAFYLSLISKKQRRGYNETAIAGSGSSAASLGAGAAAKKQARADLAGGSTDKRLTALVDRLVKVNAHEISLLSGGKITVRDGQVATPLGLLTVDAINEATVLLDRLAQKPTDHDLLGRYLTLVPQSVGRGRDWTESFFSGSRTVDQQRTFLDQLRSSIEAAEAADVDVKSDKRAFAYTLTPVDDAKVIRDIEKMFAATRNAKHVSAGMRLTNVYATTSPASEAAFDKVAAEIGNVRRMWHGTRAHNLLSILATGLQVPGRNQGIHIAGRMFGDGIYFSDQSTKSLNYSRGGQWSVGVDSRCMMLLADVAMGHEYRPNLYPEGRGACNKALGGRWADPKTGKKFNSVNVKAGTSGVLNHEAIVPGPKNVALRYLCEFES